MMLPSFFAQTSLYKLDEHQLLDYQDGLGKRRWTQRAAQCEKQCFIAVEKANVMSGFDHIALRLRSQVIDLFLDNVVVFSSVCLPHLQD